jgi:hypothetical protein
MTTEAAVFAVLLCGCRARIAPGLAAAPLLVCMRHCTAQRFVIDGDASQQ